MLIAIIAAVVLMLLLAALFAFYHKTFYSPPRNDDIDVPDGNSKRPYGETSRKLTERLCGLPCEFVTTKSHDGLTLSARYYKGEDGRPLCICFHGYHGSAVRDFAGGGLFLIDEGYNVMLVDERAHGRSQGHTITFGIKERFDVVSWIDFARGRFGKDIPIYLFGISMGGGTVLMASGQKLPENVRGIVADCPYNSPKDIIQHVCRRIGFNPVLSWPVIWLSALVYGHFNINETTALIEAKKTEVPILIIHGEGDDFVPMYMSRQVRDANPGMITMYTFPEAGHGLSYLYDTERYQTTVREWMENNK